MIEYRETSGGVTGDGRTLVGVVTPFNTWTQIGARDKGGFEERISPGAFTKTLQERDAVLINAHNTGQPMARMGVPAGGEWSGHLSLTPDPAVGLRCYAEPIDASYSRDVLAGAKAGVIPGMSFGFEVIKDRWTDDEGRDSTPMHGTRRTIDEVRLHECTTTAFPAYLTTELSARNRDLDALLEQRAAAQRAAKASYSDLHVCGDCGSTGQYDPHCTACGKPMVEPDTGEDVFCGQCGAELGDDRDSHICETRETVGDKVLDAVAQLISAVNDLPEDQRAEKLAEVRSLLAEVPAPGAGDGHSNEVESRLEAAMAKAIYRL